MIWYCNKCGSDKVSQQVSFYVPMNNKTPASVLDGLREHQYDDVYWCEVCDDDCDPVKK